VGRKTLTQSINQFDQSVSYHMFYTYLHWRVSVKLKRDASFFRHTLVF